MHNPGVTDGNRSHERELQATTYGEDYMNIDDNLFGLDSEGRDLIFGRNGMSDNTNHRSQQYEPTPMQTDSSDLNNILAQMPTPVSNNIRASSETNSFMSPLQVDQQGYDRLTGVQYPPQGNDDMYFTPLISPAVTPMDVLRLPETDSVVPSMDPVYFSPLTSPALERFPPPQSDTRRTQSMVGLSSLPPSRRSAENLAEGQRNVRRAPYSPVARANMSRKRNSITSLNLNANGSQSDQSSDSVSPEPLPSSSMPPPPPRNTSSNKLHEKSTTNGRQTKHRQKRSAPGNSDVSPATPSSFLNMTLQHPEQRQQGGQGGHVESTVTFDHGTSTDTSPATVKSAGSTPTFGPNNTAPSMGSPSFISIPASYDPNSAGPSANSALSSGSVVHRPLRQSSRGQSRSSRTSSDVAHTLASKSNYQNILEGNHSQLGLSYPKELSSGIESRRTSHKVAEQARRSRINNAIDQLGAMLPGETDGISKAITVERAIEYIKSLEEQLAQAKAELNAKK